MGVMKPLTYSQAFQQGVREEMQRDDSIVILGTDLYIRGGHWGQVKGLGPEFGNGRIRDTPISEAAMVAAGVGGALNGLRPIVDLNFIDFAFGAMDEIINQAVKIRYMWGAPVPLVIRGTSGVAFGAAQHNNQLEGWFASTPGARGGDAGDRRRCARAHQDLAARRGSRDLPDAQDAHWRAGRD